MCVYTTYLFTRATVFPCPWVRETTPPPLTHIRTPRVPVPSTIQLDKIFWGNSVSTDNRPSERNDRPIDHKGRGMTCHETRFKNYDGSNDEREKWTVQRMSKECPKMSKECPRKPFSGCWKSCEKLKISTWTYFGYVLVCICKLKYYWKWVIRKWQQNNIMN